MPSKNPATPSTQTLSKPLTALLAITLLGCWMVLSDIHVAAADDSTTSDESTKSSAAEFRVDGGSATLNGKTLWIPVKAADAQRGHIAIHRIAAPLRSLGWKDHPDHLLKFTPEPERWVFSWKRVPTNDATIEVVFDKPVQLTSALGPVQPTADGSVMLHAYQAHTHGEKLRYEPQWYKNTVGYWTVPSDYATWALNIDQPGEFSVAVLQGCGGGQGGSDAQLTLRRDDNVKVELTFQTIDTGHFQNFRWHPLGTIKIDEAGEYQLRISPQRIAKNALFDVRAVHLVRQAK